MKLYPYQQSMNEKTFELLKVNKSVLCQSATGSGKTVIMSDFISRWLKLNPGKKVLVSVHRDELVTQTSETLARFGILNEKITAKSKPTFVTDVYVGMTQTVWSRKLSLDIGLMIIDEAHDQTHLKTFALFPDAVRVGYTATPSINKRFSFYKCGYCEKKSDIKSICCYNEPMEKYSAPVTLSESYNDIIIGPPIKRLIEEGALCDEIVYTYDYYENLEAKGDDDFDENEIAEESAKHDQNVLEEYLEKAPGKKTMIFTASTKQNISLVETFIGHPIKSYDSVNKQEENRIQVVDWFRNTEGAILVSTGTFTTGFDVKEVECVMVNRPTKSLNLWFQMIGRGARTTEKIYKENFIVIDLGGNVKRLGKWSDPVDWFKIFWHGINPEKKKKEMLLQCDACGYNFVGFLNDPCESCEHINAPIVRDILPGGENQNENERVLKSTTSQSVIPLPNGRKIADYVIRTTNNKKDYYRIIIEKYIDLWRLNGVKVDVYEKRILSGRLEERIKHYLKQMYGFVNSISEGVPRTYEYLINKIKEKLKACFM